MRSINNKNTLAHYSGNIWLTKPENFSSPVFQKQSINVCVEHGGGFAAADYLELYPNGIYYKKGKPIGKLYEPAFDKYIERLAGFGGESEKQLFSRVCECYKELGSIAVTAKKLGMPTARVQRILISRGEYSSELTEQVAWLYDGGKGKSITDIAEILAISKSTVLKNMPYKK